MKMKVRFSVQLIDLYFFPDPNRYINRLRGMQVNLQNSLFNHVMTQALVNAETSDIRGKYDIRLA